MSVKHHRGNEPDYRFPAEYERHARLMSKKLERFSGKVLALDLGMKYGFAYLLGQKLVYGYNSVSPTRYASQLASAFEFYNHIKIISREMGGLDAIVFEEVHGVKGVYAMQINGMFIGCMLTAARDLDTRIVKGYQVGAIKGYACGVGNASKSQMIRAANERYGLSLDPKNDKHSDMADAIHLLSLAMESLLDMGPLDDYIRITMRIGQGTKNKINAKI